jgi:hypothetical protein
MKVKEDWRYWEFEEMMYHGPIFEGYITGK